MPPEESDMHIKRELLRNAPHMQKLKAFVEKMRASLSSKDDEVPDFDPCDGGENATILFLFEKPGPMACRKKGGSGFISQDNNDRTAEATKEFLKRAEIDRKTAIFWNAIPVWNGTRKITAAEKKDAAQKLEELLKITSKVKSIVLVGEKAQRVGKSMNLKNYNVFNSMHPSPINKASRRAQWERIPQDWAKANPKK